jgi:hypothetical protein
MELPKNWTLLEWPTFAWWRVRLCLIDPENAGGGHWIGTTISRRCC